MKSENVLNASFICLWDYTVQIQTHFVRRKEMRSDAYLTDCYQDGTGDQFFPAAMPLFQNNLIKMRISRTIIFLFSPMTGTKNKMTKRGAKQKEQKRDKRTRKGCAFLCVLFASQSIHADCVRCTYKNY